MKSHKIIALFVALQVMRSVLAGVAGFHLVSLSPQVDPAGTTQLGLDYTLAISSAELGSPANNEMGYLIDSTSYTHGGYLVLSDPTTFEDSYIDYVLNIPAFQDANANGQSDFYDISQAVGSTSKGLYNDGNGGTGTINATWKRNAGSIQGQLTLAFPNLGLTFVHAFRLLEFDGVWTYTRTGTNITGPISLTLAEDASQQLTGAFSANLNNTNQLQISSQTVGEGTSSFNYIPLDNLDRTGTNYLGAIGFNPLSPISDGSVFYFWSVLIEDSNDANGNGVPDMSDAISATSPTPPKLLISRTDQELILTIQGEPNRKYNLERASNLINPSWLNFQTGTMASSEQIVKIPLPKDSQIYYRAVVNEAATP